MGPTTAPETSSGNLPCAPCKALRTSEDGTNDGSRNVVGKLTSRTVQSSKDQWRWDPQRLPKRRREIYLAHQKSDLNAVWLPSNPCASWFAPWQRLSTNRRTEPDLSGVTPRTTSSRPTQRCPKSYFKRQASVAAWRQNSVHEKYDELCPSTAPCVSQSSLHRIRPDTQHNVCISALLSSIAWISDDDDDNGTCEYHILFAQIYCSILIAFRWGFRLLYFRTVDLLILYKASCFLSAKMIFIRIIPQFHIRL